MNYNELLEKHQQEFDEFSKDKIYVAFGTKEQIIEKLHENNLELSDLINLGNGAFIKKEHEHELNELIERQSKEKHEYTLNNIYEVVTYQCWNYEIEISLSYSYHDLIYKIIGLSKDEANEHASDISKAFEDYRKEFHELN